MIEAVLFGAACAVRFIRRVPVSHAAVFAASPAGAACTSMETHSSFRSFPQAAFIKTCVKLQRFPAGIHLFRPPLRSANLCKITTLSQLVCHFPVAYLHRAVLVPAEHFRKKCWKITQVSLPFHLRTCWKSAQVSPLSGCNLHRFFSI